MALGIKVSSRKANSAGCVILLVFACISETGCHRNVPVTRNSRSENAKALARTIAMLREGEGVNTQYRILFYGQSISDKKWTDIASRNMAQNYPNVNFKFSNLAIGGNGASLLKRAVARDIDQFYPDLVVFHDYGGERDYEDIIKIIRSRSSAEIILQTDHLTARPEPLCPVGLNVTFRTPLGCIGTIWLHQRNWDDYMSGAVIPKMAVQFGAAIDPRRAGWNAYLNRHRLEPSQLLQDGVHPNDRGWHLAASLFTEFFNTTVRFTTPSTTSLVIITPNNQMKSRQLHFEGNRLEIISSRPLPNPIKATVDGVASEQLPGCWITTRVSSVPWIPEWPALRQVDISDDRLEADEWTVKLDQFNDDLTNFRFRLYSKLHGFDGEGNGSDDFVSTSGLIKIDASDWVLGDAMKSRPVAIPQTLTLHWSRGNVCGHRPDVDAKISPSEYHYIIATGLENNKHVATVVTAQNSYQTIRAFMSYKPWLLP